MKYQDYKDFTLEDYRKLWSKQDDHVGMSLYQYYLVSMNNTPEGMNVGFVKRFLHHDLEVARQASIGSLEEIKKDLEGKYSIDVIEDYDPALGTSYNYAILLIQTRDASKKICIESTMDDFYNQPGEEEKVFGELRSLNPDSVFLDNILKPESLQKVMEEVKIPNKPGLHTVKLPGGITMKINVT